MKCRCGESFESCRFPISHSHPSIDSIKLPGKQSAILARYSSMSQFTSADREAWDRSSHELMAGRN